MQYLHCSNNKCTNSAKGDNGLLPETEFYIEYRTIRGRYAQCRICTQELKKTPAYREQRKLYRGSSLGKIRRREANWKRQGIKNPDGTWFKWENWLVALGKQNSKCKFCSNVSDLVPDHNHKTGIFRFILCQSCNKMLNFARDNSETLKIAASLLKELESYPRG